MWKNDLGVDVELKNVEWGNYLDKQKVLDYSVSRAGWIGKTIPLVDIPSNTAMVVGRR